MSAFEEHNNALWVEKYRPPSIKQMILPKTFMTFFMEISEKKKKLPNLLLRSSTPGSGKTSVGKALIKDLGGDYLYVNASTESGIDVLRTRIQKFATTISLRGGLKIVMFDEVDGASVNLQRGLRAFIEEFSGTCRFILTCNYINKIIPALRSRTQEFDFNMNNDVMRAEMLPKIIRRLNKVLEIEGVSVENGVVDKLADSFYPDIRKMYNILQQQSSMTGGSITSQILNMGVVNTELWDLILKKNFKAVRAYISEQAYDPNDLYRPMFDELVPMLPSNARAKAIIEIADYMDRATRTMDAEVTLSACILAIMTMPEFAE